jgi:hypothetical protein
MSREMSARGQALLEDLPPVLQRNHVMRAICNAEGSEFEILDEKIDMVRRNLIPVTTRELLAIVETELGLSVDDALSDDDRAATVVAYMSRAALDDTGVNWERLAGFILGTSWTYSVGGVNNSELVVTVSFAEGSVRADLAQSLLETITPATMTINVVYAEGFLLDISPLDDDLFAG